MGFLSGLFGGKAPAAPSVSDMVNGQTQANQNTALFNAGLNRINQYNPWGSTTYKNNNGVWSQSVDLNDNLKSQLNSQQQAGAGLGIFGLGKLDDVQGAMGSPFSYGNVAQPAPVADENYRNQVVNSLYGQATSRLDPRFGREEDSIRTRLLNQGIPEGSAAWNDAMSQFGQYKNDAYTSAMNSAIGQGTDAMNTLFGMQLQGRQQGINEYNDQRVGDYNELQALLGSPVQSPDFAGYATAEAAAPDVMGAYNTNYAGQMNAYNQKRATGNALLGAIGGLAGSALGGPIGGMIGSKIFGMPYSAGQPTAAGKQ